MYYLWYLASGVDSYIVLNVGARSMKQHIWNYVLWVGMTTGITFSKLIILGTETSQLELM